jgi:hypothetical protein
MEPDAELRTMLERYSGSEPSHPWEQTKRDVHRLAERLLSVLQGFKTAAEDAVEIEHELEGEIGDVDQKARDLLDLLWVSDWYGDQPPEDTALFDALADAVGWTAKEV